MAMPSGDSPADGAGVLPLPAGPPPDRRSGRRPGTCDWISTSPGSGASSIVLTLVADLLGLAVPDDAAQTGEPCIRSTASAATRPSWPARRRSSSSLLTVGPDRLRRRAHRRPPRLGAEVLMAAAPLRRYVAYSSSTEARGSGRATGRPCTARCRRSRPTSRSTPAASASTSSSAPRPDGDVRVHCYTTWDTPGQLEAFLERGYTFERLLADVGRPRRRAEPRHGEDLLMEEPRQPHARPARSSAIATSARTSATRGGPVSRAWVDPRGDRRPLPRLDADGLLPRARAALEPAPACTSSTSPRSSS